MFLNYCFYFFQALRHLRFRPAVAIIQLHTALKSLYFYIYLLIFGLQALLERKRSSKGDAKGKGKFTEAEGEQMPARPNQRKPAPLTAPVDTEHSAQSKPWRRWIKRIARHCVSAKACCALASCGCLLVNTQFCNDNVSPVVPTFLFPRAATLHQPPPTTTTGWEITVASSSS